MTARRQTRAARSGRRWSSCAVALFGALSVARGQETDGAGETLAGRRLLNPEPDDRVRLEEIAAWIQDRDFAEAVRGVHELMTGPDPRGLQPHPANPRLYVTAGEVARLRLGGAWSEALTPYRKMADGAAEDLFRLSGEADGESVLRRIATGYFHTPFGARATARLAALAFDRGDFVGAATLWTRLYRESRGAGTDAAATLAKACAAWQAARDAARVRELSGDARGRHAGAAVTLAGDRVPLAEFLARLPERPPVAHAEMRPSVAEAWTSLAGSAAGVDVMPDCAPVPAAAWSAAAGGGSGGGPVHPVIVGGMVLCRRDDGVTATALDTGDELWRWREGPMARPAEAGAAAAPNPLAGRAGDMGRYALTVAGDRAFAVCRFARVAPDVVRLQSADQWADGSSLVALAFDRRGARTVWEVGNGKGASEPAQRMTYFAPPTVYAGRLYLTARSGNEYRGLCLDAATGETIWDQALGIVPLRGDETLAWQQAFALESITERGSPVAVDRGRAYLTTNTGLVLALRADTGAPLWAYQYPSVVSGLSSDPTTLSVLGQTVWFATAGQPLLPVNPLIVSAGRVICLPCDSPHVFALNAETGELLWQRDRGRQRDLTAVNADAVLLSGPDLVLVGIADGAIRQRTGADILGRPAVTSREAWAAETGGLLKWNLTTYAVERLATDGVDEHLGRALSAGGVLVTGDGSGLSAFMDAESAARSLAGRLSRAGGADERADLNARRGAVCLATGRLEEADAALAAACAPAAAGRPLPARVRRLRERLCAAWLVRGREAEARPVAEQALRRAEALASGEDGKFAILEASVRMVERFDGAAAAAALAQAASERERGAARDRAQEQIARLIRAHGDSAGVALDEQAGPAIETALVAGDEAALVAAFRRWPHAKRAGEAMLAAAERTLARAQPASPDAARAAARASRLLGEVKRSVRADARLRAEAARTVMDLRFRPNAAAAQQPAWDRADPSAPVRFAGFDGTVGDLAAQVRVATRPPARIEDEEFVFIAPPLRTAFTRQGGAGRVLRDSQSRAVRIGDRLFLWGAGEVACLDALEDDAGRAIVWRAAFQPDPGTDVVQGQLTAKGRRLAVTDGVHLALFDAGSGVPVYRKPIPGLTLASEGRVTASGDWLAVAGGQGNLACVSLASAEVVWRAVVPGLDWSVRLQDELLLAPMRQGFVCFDVRTGRRLLTVPRAAPHPETVNAVLTSAGWAVTVGAGGRVAAWDARSAGTNPVQRVKLGGEGWSVAGVGERYLGLRGAGNEATVLDLAEGGREIRLSFGDDAGRRPIGMAFRGDRALALHAAVAAEGRTVAPALTAFALPSGAKVWELALVPATAGSCHPPQMELRGDFVSVAVSPVDGAAAPSLYVVAFGDGRSVNPVPSLPAGWRGAARAGCPVVMNGRLIVECAEGIACLKGEE